MGSKMKIIKRLKKEESSKVFATEYGVDISTILEIKKNSDSVLKFVSFLVSEEGSTSRKP